MIHLEINALAISESLSKVIEDHIPLLKSFAANSIPNKSLESKNNEMEILFKLEDSIKAEEHIRIKRIFKTMKDLVAMCIKLIKKEEKSKPKQDKEKQHFEEDKLEKAIITPMGNEPLQLQKKESLKPLKSQHTIPLDKDKNYVQNEFFLGLKDTIDEIQNNKILNSLWFSTAELLSTLSEHFSQTLNISNPLLFKIIPIIECFFILYKIISEEPFGTEKSNQFLQTGLSKQKSIRISKMQSFVEQSSNTLNKSFSLLKSSSFNFQDLFSFICNKNKTLINLMVKLNISLLDDSLSMVIQKMPLILDFDIKRSYFK